MTRSIKLLKAMEVVEKYGLSVDDVRKNLRFTNLIIGCIDENLICVNPLPSEPTNPICTYCPFNSSDRYLSTSCVKHMIRAETYMQHAYDITKEERLEVVIEQLKNIAEILKVLNEE